VGGKGNQHPGFDDDLNEVLKNVPEEQRGGFVVGDNRDASLRDVLNDYAKRVSEEGGSCIMCGSEELDRLGTIELPHDLAKKHGLNPGAVTAYALCSGCVGVSNEDLGLALERAMSGED